MNKRIKELAKKSGFGIDANNIYTAKLEHLPITENMEKFAELIIRECSTLAYDGPNGILEYFGLGVEE